MIQKEKLIKNLEELERLGKTALPLLNKHVSSALFFSDLGRKEQHALLEKFQAMTVVQTKHIEIIGQIKNEILRGKKDVY
ncbi:MAG: hypothetical protein PHS37_04960 [Candidatus Omnitrophica bacterium]|nr:hypothetical protein [Candidatus Omnitrophota bacterium]